MVLMLKERDNLMRIRSSALIVLAVRTAGSSASSIHLSSANGSRSATCTSTTMPVFETTYATVCILPMTGLENYLFQICYMLVHKPSPSLDKFVIDACSKSLRIALKVHWFLMAELEDSVGLFDKDVSATLSKRYPELYKEGINNTFFRWKVVIVWAIFSFYQSMVIYYFTVISSQNGHNSAGKIFLLSLVKMVTILLRRYLVFGA